MIKPKKPIRFFTFFILFIGFMYLSVRSCTGEKRQVTFVDAEKVSKNVDKATNVSSELKDFISDVKKEARVNKGKDLVVEEVIETKEEREHAEKRAKKIKALSKKAIVKKPSRVRKVKSSLRMNLSLSGKGYALDSRSKAKLKGAVKVLRSNLKVVKVTGFYFSGEAKSVAVVRATVLKQELIRAGLSSKTSIKTLSPVLRRVKEDFGSVAFY